MRKTIFISALLMLCLHSCRYFVKEKYKMKNNLQCTTKQMYLQQLMRKGIFNADQLLYVDSTHYWHFYNSMLQQDSSIVYIGTYVNDSEQVKKSAVILNNSSCSGRLENEIKLMQSQTVFDAVDLTRKPFIDQLGLYALKNHQPFHRDNQISKCILLAFSYSFGNYYNQLYEKINRQLQHHPTAKVYIVCLDPVYRLPD